MDVCHKSKNSYSHVITYLGIILLTSCAIPDYTLNNGIKVFDRQIDEHVSQEELKILINHIEPKLKYLDLLRGWHLVLTNAWLAVPKTKTKLILASGLAVPKDRVIFLKTFPGCFADNALTHELTHAVFWELFHGADGQHTDHFWKTANDFRDVLMKKFCPGYVADKPKKIKAKIIKIN